MKYLPLMKTIDLDELSIVNGAWNPGQSWDACTALIPKGAAAGSALGGATGATLGIVSSVPTFGITAIPASLIGAAHGSALGAPIGAGVACATGFGADLYQQMNAPAPAAAPAAKK